MENSTEVENHMTSCERVLEYTNLPVEADVVGNTVANDSICPPDWPAKGRIQFQDVSLQYTEGSPKVLSELTLDISGGSRVGVCGRTGAGKSSILVKQRQGSCMLTFVTGCVVPTCSYLRQSPYRWNPNGPVELKKASVVVERHPTRSCSLQYHSAQEFGSIQLAYVSLLGSVLIICRRRCGSLASTRRCTTSTARFCHAQ